LCSYNLGVGVKKNFSAKNHPSKGNTKMRNYTKKTEITKTKTKKTQLQKKNKTGNKIQLNCKRKKKLEINFNSTAK
jgi:hypothetical protein